METDFLVIGSGIAGLTYALKTANAFPDKKITVITKTQADETNTKYAQGGIAGVWDEERDSYNKHIEDTLIAGDGLCNQHIVEIVVKEGPERIKEIIAYGAEFDKDEKGAYSLGKEGGHSENRILHHKDVTGKEMERALLQQLATAPNIELINHCFVVDIITQHHLGFLVTKSTLDITCFGVYVLNLHTNHIEKILAKVTLLATGGCGQAYRTTTNPRIATGDGIAMVYRAKGKIENMEFIQFHPTALYEPGISPSFLITEAVRGDGGILRNKSGEAFMEQYDVRKDLAPRDIVARAIDNEMKRTGTEHVYLDCRHMNKEKFVHHFPNIYAKCLAMGIDVVQQMIPVAPAAHYSCGGIKTDDWGRTSIQHLYACGECASTGLHGANRLASNSLLEAMVFGHRCYLDSAEKINTLSFETKIPDLAQKENEITMADLAGMMYESLQQKIITLEDEVIVYPAHGAGSSCGKNLGSETFSTIGEQKRTNYALQTESKAAFIEAVTEGLSTPPLYFPINAKINKEGYESLDALLDKGLRPLSVAAFKAKAAADDVLILDTRPSGIFTQGFVPGSVSIGLDGRFAEWAGSILPFDKTFILVTDPGKERETIVRLARVGFDKIDGYLDGSYAAWLASGESIDMIIDVEADELAMDLPFDEKILIVDVRKVPEYADGHIKDAMNIPLDTLTDPGSMASFDESQNIYVHCAGGYRSVIASSLIKKEGFHNIRNVVGGWSKIKLLTDKFEIEKDAEVLN